MSRPDPSQRHGPHLVLVTGAGRSDTSSLAGSLARLGFHVPQPDVEAGPTSAHRSHESRWVSEFHQKLLSRAFIHDLDSRPRARALADELQASGDVTADLAGWLRHQLDEPRIVVNDPQAYWFAASWVSVAQELGVNLSFLTSIRHPVEVVTSSDLAREQGGPEADRRAQETAMVAGWVHAAFLTEKDSRHSPRAFMRHTDLVEDWRSALGRAGDQLELTFDDDLTPGQSHPNDELIDASPGPAVTWENVPAPTALRDLAEEVWQLLCSLVEDPYDQGTSDRMDELHAGYDIMFEEAVALTYAHTRAESATAVRTTDTKRKNQLKKLRRKLRNKSRQLERARARQLQPPETRRGPNAPLAARLRRRTAGRS